MIRRFCDHCGQEIKGGYLAHIYEYGYEEYGFKNDLCLECAIEVQTYINESKGEKFAERIERIANIQDEAEQLTKKIDREIERAKSEQKVRKQGGVHIE